MKIVTNGDGDEVINDIITSGNFIGANKPNGQVTVVPYWKLDKTLDEVDGCLDGVRGPYRYWMGPDGEQWEVVVPQIKSITIDRSVDNPIASCTITMYNTSHNFNEEIPDAGPGGNSGTDTLGAPFTQLGRPGYYWFERGKTSDPSSIQVDRWNQNIATGGTMKDGSPAEDPPGTPFSWQNVLIPNAMLKTYQGYGGHDMSIDEALEAGNITQTGVWLIDSVTAGTDGMLNIRCSDVGKLLEEQAIFPPLVPEDLYPLEYRPAGQSDFDDIWTQPPPHNDFSDGVEETVNVNAPTQSYGIVPMRITGSSIALRANDDVDANTDVDGHKVYDIQENDPNTFLLTQSASTPIEHVDWIEFTERQDWGHTLQNITIKPYGGGYTMYVSVEGEDGWLENGYGKTVPYGKNIDFTTNNDGQTGDEWDAAIPYIAKVPIRKEAVGSEKAITFDIPFREEYPEGVPLNKVRLSFTHYQMAPPFSGYRMGIREIDFITVSTFPEQTYFMTKRQPALKPNGGLNIVDSDLAVGVAAHPIKGHWFVTRSGEVWADRGAPIIEPVTDGRGNSASAANDLTHITTVARPAQPAVAAVPGTPGTPYVPPKDTAINYSEAQLFLKGSYYIDSNTGDAALREARPAILELNSPERGAKITIVGRAAGGTRDGNLLLARQRAAAVYLNLCGGGRDKEAVQALTGLTTGKNQDLNHVRYAITDWNVDLIVFAMGLSPDGVLRCPSRGNSWTWEVRATPGFDRNGADVIVTRQWEPAKEGTPGTPGSPYIPAVPAQDLYSYDAGGCTAMAAHPLGTGYWILHANGHVEAFGKLPDGSPLPMYGETVDESYAEENNDFAHLTLMGEKAQGIASTYDGTGYWIIWGNGTIRGYGSVSGYTGQVPVSQETIALEALSVNWPVPYQHLRGTAICSFPDALGFWAVDGCGGVFVHSEAGDSSTENPDLRHYGQFSNRTFNGAVDAKYAQAGFADQWELTYQGEYINSIECTEDGRGYWLLGLSGRIAQFGNAVGKGVTDIYAPYRKDIIPLDPYLGTELDLNLARLRQDRVQDICRMPDDNGFYALLGNSEVHPLTDYWWGNPAYWGYESNYYHAGVFNDYKEIIKELVAWCGFTLFDVDNQPTSTSLPVHAFLENTGINSDSTITVDQLDKRSVLDVINMLREVVSYLIFVDDMGAVHFESANIWRAGNFINMIQNPTTLASGEYLLTGQNPDGDWVRDWTPSIPVVDERLNLMSYSAQSDAESIVSEIIIGSNEPAFNDVTNTVYTRFVPPAESVPLKGGGEATLSRGIVKTAMWLNDLFTDSEEQALMAELIALNAFFAQRIGNLQTIANPTIEINDQIKIIERNTSESYIHYVRSIGSSMDLDAGTYFMSMNTNWMGTDDANWVITRGTGIIDHLTRIEISELVDAWQIRAGKGLETGQIGTGLVNLITWETDTPASAPVSGDWTWTGTLTTTSDTEITIYVDRFAREVLGPFNLNIDGQDYEITNVNQVIPLGAMTAGEYVTTLTGTAVRTGNGNVTLRAKGATGRSASFSGTLRVSGSGTGGLPPAPVVTFAGLNDDDDAIFNIAQANGVIEVTGYTYSLNGGAYQSITATHVGTVAKVTIPDLEVGDYLYFKAINAVGTSVRSNRVEIRGAPAAPVITAAVTSGSNKVAVSFTQPSDGGEQILGYQFSVNSTTMEGVVDETVSPLYVYGAVVDDVIRIAAYNNSGVSATSNAVTVTQGAITVPAKPTLSFQKLDSGNAIMRVEGDDGGAAITNYKYLKNGTVTASDGDNPSFVKEDLVELTTKLNEHDGGYPSRYPYTNPAYGNGAGPTWSDNPSNPNTAYGRACGDVDLVAQAGGTYPGIDGIHPWFELTTEEGSEQTGSSMVEVRRMGLAVHRASTGEWEVVCESQDVWTPVAATNDNGQKGRYPTTKSPEGHIKVGLGSGATDQGYRFAQSIAEGNGWTPGDVDTPGYGRIRAHAAAYTGFEDGMAYMNPDNRGPQNAGITADIDGIVMWVQARVIGSPSHYRLLPGFDIMPRFTAVGSPNEGQWPGHWGAAYQPTSEWRTMVCSTLSEAQINAWDDPPIPGYNAGTFTGGTYTAFSPAQTTSPLELAAVAGDKVSVKAVNSVGDSSASNTVTVSNTAVIFEPTAPTIALSSYDGVAQEATITITAPTDDGGELLGYEYTTEFQYPWTSTEQDTASTQVIRVQRGSSLLLRAVNSAGESGASNIVTIPTTVPGTPIVTQLDYNTTYARLRYLVSDTGGEPLTSVGWSVNSGSWTDIITDDPDAVVQVTCSVSDSVRIRVGNSQGFSSPSTAVTITNVTPGTRPGPPSNFVIEHYETGNVTVSFTQASDGGSPITDYEYWDTNTSSFVSSGYDASPVIVPGALGSTLTLRAVNVYGPGTSGYTTIFEPEDNAPNGERVLLRLIPEADPSKHITFELQGGGYGGYTFASGGSKGNVRFGAYNLNDTGYETTNLAGTPVTIPASDVPFETAKLISGSFTEFQAALDGTFVDGFRRNGHRVRGLLILDNRTRNVYLPKIDMISLSEVSFYGYSTGANTTISRPGTYGDPAAFGIKATSAGDKADIEVFLGLTSGQLGDLYTLNPTGASNIYAALDSNGVADINGDGVGWNITTLGPNNVAVATVDFGVFYSTAAWPGSGDDWPGTGYKRMFKFFTVPR